MQKLTEHIIAFRLNLGMFGVDIYGTAIILNDNKSEVNNSSKIRSALNKKHGSIAYHLIRQNISAGVVQIGWISTSDNIAGKLTEILTEAKRKTLFSN